MGWFPKDLLKVAAQGDFESYESMVGMDRFAAAEIQCGGDKEAAHQMLCNDGRMQDHDRALLRAFDAQFSSQHPDACIKVLMRDYWNQNDGKDIELLFVTESEYLNFLDTHRNAEWNDYCQGNGDGSIGYLNIRVTFPDGREEKVS